MSTAVERIPIPLPSPLLDPQEAKDRIIESVRGELRRLGLTLAGFGDAVEKKILDHLTGKTAYTSPGPLYLALTTVAVAESDTGGTITEANYTGYARKQIPAADMTAAAGAASETHNSVTETFANCTAGSSTVIGWALMSSSSGAGDVVMFGTCTSTVISTTQTPATVAASGLSLTLD
jgi:hypothetical protein